MRTAIKFALITLVILAALAGGSMLLPRRLFYRERRPTRLGRATNKGVAWLSARGLPIQVALETAGRFSGQRSSVPLVPVTIDGETFLVSMLGEASDWVQNVRAAGGEATIRHGGRRNVSLTDVAAAERAPVLKAYLKRAFGARPHFPIGPDAPLSAFEAIAADYPVFRVASRSALPIETFRRNVSMASPQAPTDKATG
jgi:hypothetical protein